MKEILITGGNGFIGTHLVNHLVTTFGNGVSIEIVDDLSNSTLNSERLKFWHSNDITFCHSSVESFKPFRGEKYDYIYHLASPVGPAGVLKYAGRLASTILNDSLEMAQLALSCDANLLVVSTSEVYGFNPSEGVFQSEDIPKIVPSNVTVRLEYGIGKLTTEIALLNLAKVEPLKVNFVRPFNIVGPYQKGESGFVLPRFVDAALNNRPLTVFGDGEQKRSFTGVYDIVTALVLIMQSSYQGKIYNVGNPRNICSIKELAGRVINCTSSKSEIQFVDPKTIYGPLYEEAWNKIPDISRLITDFMWEPTYLLTDIIRDYVESVWEG